MIRNLGYPNISLAFSLIVLSFKPTFALSEQVHWQTVSAEQLQAFLKSKGACVYASADIYTRISKNGTCESWDSGPWPIKPDNRARPGDFAACGEPSVFCIFSGTRAPGTINELGGCFAAYYNIYSGQYEDPLFDKLGDKRQVFVPRPCDQKAVTQILNTKISVATTSNIFDPKFKYIKKTIYQTYVAAPASGRSFVFKPSSRVLINDFRVYPLFGPSK